MRVSSVGVDVLTTTDANLLFNSDFAQAPLHSKGTITFSSSTIRTLSYGKTFTNMPMVMFLVAGSTTFSNLFINDWVLSASLSNASAYVRVRNSSFTYYAPQRDGLTARYIIWDLDL